MRSPRGRVTTLGAVTRRRGAVVLLIPTLALWACGCGADQEPDGAGPEFDIVEAGYDAVLDGPVIEPDELPFAELAFSPSEQALFDQAVWLLRQPCLTEAGYREPARTQATVGDGVDPARRYYSVEPDQAATVGYALEPSSGATATAAYDRAFDAMVDEMAPADRAAFGDVLFGCIRRAEQQLCGGGDLTQGDGYCHRSMMLTSDRDAISYEAARESDAVREATRRWSACMADDGYRFTAVDEAWNVGAALPATEGAAQAVVDMACKDEARLVEAWATVEGTVQETMIERNPGFYDDLPAAHDAVVQRARAVVEPTSS